MRLTIAAKTLMALTQGYDEKARKVNFRAFLQLLVKNGQLGDWEEILSLYNDYLSQNQGRLAATLYYHQTKPSTTEIRQIERWLCHQLRVQALDWNFVANDQGVGWQVVAGGKRWDWTLGRQLTRFEQNLRAI
jgi:F0F1-type ATP synthase delta subunit